ncbi:DnaD domain protein [Bacillus velezensis]|uniref:DnaD domain protein n=1 Tax=Bacillus TaxID=1386 RepID=UPI0009F73934|nr:MULTISPECIES: DnaD domain protein [Bacillus amyloliquefaciens group]MBW8600381.1 DnaD domain protein [Bacillus amyloliquefaciens]MCQ9152132.1 DnaD domain protein [Bacillus amyloliquefaciens]MEE3673374.1 DnaD domain protein [Bacillus velezensis]OQV37791.1 DnaD domain protein [Bacillus velezensis]QBK80129.1 DnaD domain protein [Bacillus velezensis]
MDTQGLGYVILPRLPFKDSRDETIYDHLFKRAEYRTDQDLELGQTIIKLVELAKRFNWSSDQIKYSLDRMVKQEYLKLDRLPQKRGFIVTVLNYADYIQLGNYNKKKDLVQVSEERKEVDEKVKNVFELFENKVARTIGPIEAQRIGYMVEDYGEEKVMEAMKQAFRNKGSNVGLNYIEAVLSNPFTQKRKEKKQHDSSQNTKYGHGNGGHSQKTTGQVSPIFSGTGRLRRKG